MTSGLRGGDPLTMVVNFVLRTACGDARATKTVWVLDWSDAMLLSAGRR